MVQVGPVGMRFTKPTCALAPRNRRHSAAVTLIRQCGTVPRAARRALSHAGLAVRGFLHLQLQASTSTTLPSTCSIFRLLSAQTANHHTLTAPSTSHATHTNFLATIHEHCRLRLADCSLTCRGRSTELLLPSRQIPLHQNAHPPWRTWRTKRTFSPICESHQGRRLRQLCHVFQRDH